MTGAAVSHAAMGDAARHVIVTASLALFIIASWALRPASRITGGAIVIVPALRSST